MPTELDKTIMHKAWMWDDEADEPVEVEVPAPTIGIHFADVQDLLRAKHAELTMEVDDSMETVALTWTRRDRVAERIAYEEDKAKALAPTLPVDAWEGWREESGSRLRFLGEFEIWISGSGELSIVDDVDEMILKKFASPELARDAANAVAQALGGFA